MLSVQKPSGGVRRTLVACQVEGQQLRFRDLTKGHIHVQAGGKDIDVFTEHEVDVQLARQHFRVCDDEHCWDQEAVRVRVRDVDRRRARIADDEIVMNVLTEHVQVSELMQKIVRVTSGALKWSTDARSVKFDESKHDRVDFGDMEEQSGPEPVVTLAEDIEEDKVRAGAANDNRSTVVIEELQDDEDGSRMTPCEQQDVSADVDGGQHQKTPRKLARSCNVKYLDDHRKDSVRNAYNRANQADGVILKTEALDDKKAGVFKTEYKDSIPRKFSRSRRNRAGSCGYLDLKPVRRRLRKNMALHRVQSASSVIK